MPITQDRFIVQINAGVDVAQGLRKMISYVHSQYRSVLDGKMTSEDALRYIVAMANEHLLIDPNSITRISVEHSWFKEHGARNARKAHHMAVKRRKAGLTERAPTDHVTLDPLPQSSYPTKRFPQFPETSPEIDSAAKDRADAESAWQDPELIRKHKEYLAQKAPKPENLFNNEEPNNTSPDEEIQQ